MLTPSRPPDGFDAIKDLDANKDDKIDSADSVFAARYMNCFDNAAIESSAAA